MNHLSLARPASLPAKHRRVVRPTHVPLALLIAILFMIIQLIPGVSQAQTSTCRAENFYLRNDTSKGLFTLYNCSPASTAAINNVLSNTDAAHLTYTNPGLAQLRSTDLYMANSQWVIWIDQTTAPGILRGLWPVDAAGAPAPAQNQWYEPYYNVPGGTGLRSLVQVVQGFFGANNPQANGYKGLHVEIWRQPGLNFYTYRNSPADASGITPSASQVVASYRSRLVDGNNSYTYIDPVTGSQRQLRFYTAYFLFPNQFQIHTALGGVQTTQASATTYIQGDAGGLLLQVNRACPPYTNCNSRFGYTAQQVRSNSFSKVAVSSTVPVTLGPATNPACVSISGNVYELLPTNCETFTSTEDRAIASTSYSSFSPTWTLRTFNSSPQWSVAPTWSGGNTAGWGRLIAYHYNDGRLGLSGYGSLDIVVRPPNFGAGGALAVDDTTAGQLRWTATLTHN